jgi:hypothetical protein
MRRIPYQANPGNACALACFTMVSQHLFPRSRITFERLGETAHWHKGYVVWEFPVWNWLMDRGVHITDYDVIDYKTWAKEGAKGLQQSLPADEFAWYKENTYDLDEVTESIRGALAHPNFSLQKRKPTWRDVVREYHMPGICDIVLNSRVLNHQSGFAAHRVVLVEITRDEVIFHDPNQAGSGAYRQEPLHHFRQAFESMESPALARYSIVKSS